MTYDRRGRPAPKPDEAAASQAPPGAPKATAAAPNAAPNAERLARAGAGSIRPGPAGAPSAKAAGGQRAAKRSLSPRLLPLTALLVVLVLSVKVGAVWERRGDVPAAMRLEMAVSVGAPAEAAGGREPAPAQQLAAAEQKPAAGSDTRVDPFALGKSQIELLQSLSERRKELDARERAIEQREGLLVAAEHRIETKIGELKAVRAEIEGLIKKYDEQEEQQISGLVKIYETMKPKDAARIFNELEMDVLLEVFERMKASKTAPVLADMDPIRAKDITTRIAERKKMPDIN